MYGVKQESGEVICRGCFSTDRRLSPLANYDLFFSLLDDNQKLKALKSPTMQLCWECNALLRRMKSFQRQVQRAHRLLEELVADSVGDVPTRGLSRLSTCNKQDYDVIIEDELDGTEEQLIFTVKEENKVQADIINDILNPDDGHYFEDTEYLEEHTELDLIIESTENSLEETIPQKKYKRKLKRVKAKSSLQTKVKRKRIETVPIKKGNRTGLRSSGGITRPFYPNKNNRNKTGSKKTKINVTNTIKREFKKPKRKAWLNRRDASQIVKEKKENQIPDDRDASANDSQNDAPYDDKAKSNTDSKSENLDVKNANEKVEIEIDDIEQNNHLDDIASDSENDNDDKDDPDFEEKVNNDVKDDPDFEEIVSNYYKYSKNREKNKEKGESTKDSWLHKKCIRFDILNQLDEYFTEVDLGPEEIKDTLHNEISYASEKQPHSCNYCGLCFKTIKTLLKHKEKYHKQIAMCINPVYLMYRCNVCHKIVRKEHTEAHMKYMHRWRYYCNECDKDFWDKEEGMSHYKELHKLTQKSNCNLCNYVAASRKAMERHMRRIHNPVPCDICGKIAANASSMQEHKRHRHNDGSASELRYCVTCDKQFPTLFTYKCHIRISSVHNGKKVQKVPCPECGKLISSQSKSYLQFHYDRFHSEKTRFQCPHCEKYYCRKYGLKVHINTIHLMMKEPKNKMCNICGRGFSTRRTLIHHIRTHTGERPHVCPHCPAAFAQPCPLKKHLATRHGDAPNALKKGAPAALNKEAPAALNKEAPAALNKETPLP